jgi:hypothetical protein
MNEDNRELSFIIDEGGRSQALAISGTSAQSAALVADSVLVTLSAPAFVRRGSDPTALASGVDTYLLGDVTYRVAINRGDKLAFITAGATGTAYITPGV